MLFRPFRIPEDASVLTEILPRMFQYPDHPEWSLDKSEAEMLAESMSMIRRFRAFFKVLYSTSPRIRDLIGGLVCEEDGKVVGLSNIMRMGASDTWMIANVGVLPEYRRRGIARELVEGSIAKIRERGGKQIVLGVIEGNDPALDLYQKLGFQSYDLDIEFDYTQSDPPMPIALPDGYTTQMISRGNWRFRYELAKRIMPINVQRYMPVTEARYRIGFGLLLLESVISVGSRSQAMVVYDSAKCPVATTRYTARTRPDGYNRMSISLDPAHSMLAPYLIHSLLIAIAGISRAKRTSVQLHQMDRALVEAALHTGFSKRMATHMMGLIF